MTEQEATRKLNMLDEALNFQRADADESSCALQMAIKALEEIQQYRALGTVEDIQLIFSLCKDLEKMTNEYQKIGTVEELQQAINFKKYFMELYNEGLEVANWHENRDLEPLVNFIDAACN